MSRVVTLASLLAALGVGIWACSDSNSSPSGACDPNQIGSCALGQQGFCSAARQCQPCPVGSYNCDGSNQNGCEQLAPCGGGGSCVPSATGASSCPTTQYCAVQSCVACTVGSYSCDRTDTNACEQTVACGGGGQTCVPSTGGGSTCGTSQYCAGQTCVACPGGSYNCDNTDTNACEQVSACGVAQCVPSSTGTGTCGTSQYCVLDSCKACGAGSFNCDLIDSNQCESTSCSAPVSVKGHVIQACADGLYQLDVTKDESTCGTGDVDVQFTVGDAGSAPPAAGRTYTIKPSSAVNIYPADGEALAVSLGANLGNGQSGTLTVGPVSGGSFTGSYQFPIEGGTVVQGQFRADSCPFDPTSCQ